jgi:hypothetical protein
MDVVEEIGTYNNGCTLRSHEIDYVVPNVTSACALLYALHGSYGQGVAAGRPPPVTADRRNWRYEIYSTGKPCGMEDSYHLAMMIYHLSRHQTVCGIRTADIIERAMPGYMNSTVHICKAGSIGWGIPICTSPRVDWMRACPEGPAHPDGQ